MTYRGIVNNGVIVLEGDMPQDGTIVEVTPINEFQSVARNLANHPAIGIWKDRGDIPQDDVEASKELRHRLMRRADE